MAKWTSEEEDYLKKLWIHPKVTKEDLIKVFCRSYDAIGRKARSLGLGPRIEYAASTMNFEYLRQLLEVIEID